MGKNHIAQERAALSDGLAADLDFAVITTATPGVPLTIRDDEVMDGESITTLGYPQGRQILASSSVTVLG